MTRRKRLKPIDVECPYCGAGEGDACMKRGKDGAYLGFTEPHKARRDMAARLNYVDARAEQAGLL